MTMSLPRLAGLHHLSAMSSHAQDTIDFYAGILGLPLLKQTVNFDDPGTYHLYFGDPAVQLGTMTFFIWPGAHRGRVGTGGTKSVSFSIASNGDLDRWESSLTGHGITTARDLLGDSGTVLRLSDPDGLQLELVSREGSIATPPRTRSIRPSAQGELAAPRVGPIQQVTVIVSNLERSTAFYAGTLGLDVEAGATAEDRTSGRSHSLKEATSGARVPAVVLLPSDGSPPAFRLGAGVTHHFALQVATEPDLVAWRDYLNDSGTPTTDIKDRLYFRSIYFRDPDGHVIEIATNGPGFAVDEPLSGLGQQLALPPWLEDRRSEIVGRLPSLNTRPTVAL